MLRARREQPDADLEPSTAGLQEQVQTRAELRQLVADLGDLPENQRAALLLTELEDLSHAEAATVLDCEPSQVKGLVFRAREGLIERRDARSAPVRGDPRRAVHAPAAAPCAGAGCATTWPRATAARRTWRRCAASAG